MTDTRTRLHHAASEAATLIANTGRGTKREGDVLAELRAALAEDRETPAEPTRTKNGHVLLTVDTCDCNKEEGHCPVCDQGLAVCQLCGAGEIELDGPCVPKTAPSAPTMRDDLRAWREAVTAERMDALQYVMDDHALQITGFNADRLKVMNAARTLLADLRALAVGDAGKGGGTV